MRTFLVAFCALAAIAGIPAHVAAIDIDSTFGGGRGYVPVSAPETQVDTVAAIVRQPDNKVVVGGRRVVGNRGVLLLQRYGADGVIDTGFGDQGTVTFAIAGESLTPRQLFVATDGRLLVGAESATGVLLLSFTAAGQVDTSFNSTGQVVLPFEPGVGMGTSSVHLLDTDRIMVVTQNSPGATLAVTLSRYLADGHLDLSFGHQGREPIGNLGAGLSYTGVGAILADQRIALALAGNSGAVALTIVTRHGETSPGDGGVLPVLPAPLQGRTVTAIAPLAGNYFAVAAVAGAAGAQSSSITRFDPGAHVDTQFGTNGTLIVESAESGGSIAIGAVYEQLDNNLIITGSTNNGMLVARYLQRGTPDVSFNGSGNFIVPEPASRTTIGVGTVILPAGQMIHVGYGVAFGGASSRAFMISTQEGVPDIAFGTRGLIDLFGRKSPTGEFAQHVVAQDDGRILVVSATGAGTDALVGTLSRFLPDGTPDATLGANGRASFPLNGKCEWPLSIAVQQDGKIIVVGTSFNTRECDSSAIFGKRFLPNGTPEDFALSYTGITAHARSGGVAVQDDKVVVTGQDDRSLVVARAGPGGLPDLAFGVGGRILWRPGANDEAKGGALLVQADQKIIVGGAVNGTQVALLRLNADGGTDASFGVDGVTIASIAGGALEIDAMTFTPQGRILVLARASQRPILLQFNADGTIDGGFGNGGQLVLQLAIGGGQYSRFGLAVQPDGGIVVSGQTVVSPASALKLVRVTATGQIDNAFGVDGAFTWRRSIYFAAGGNGIASVGNGNLLVLGYGLPGAFLARLGVGANPTVAVVEFENSLLKHFFMTANPAEQAAVDAGAAGPGWSRTGMSFRGYVPALGIPAGQLPVCRFYGSLAIDPKTGQRRGPNSHFYTAQPAECAAVKLDPGWVLEEISFHTRLPEANGQCLAGLVPVYRNYNNRAQFNDSNHRYSTDFATYQSMVPLGWTAEGIAFCSPP